jgi:hypothetical protein
LNLLKQVYLLTKQSKLQIWQLVPDLKVLKERPATLVHKDRKVPKVLLVVLVLKVTQER